MKTTLSPLLLVLILSITKVDAQLITLHGLLQDSITHYPIAGGIITNVNSKKKTSSDSKGYFKIEASPNDFLYVLANTYHYDTVTYSYIFSDTITIYLSPSGNILPTVTVTSQYNKYQVDSIKRRGDFEASRGTELKTLSSPNSGGFGVALNLDKIFKKKYTNRKGSEQLFTATEKSTYVDYRFSPQMVAYYTRLKGDTLHSFMQRFTPAYTWLRQHPTNEDVMYYINDKLKEFKAATSY